MTLQRTLLLVRFYGVLTVLFFTNKFALHFTFVTMCEQRKRDRKKETPWFEVFAVWVFLQGSPNSQWLVLTCKAYERVKMKQGEIDESFIVYEI